jgi:DNA mismatch endonuclease, patch repair protein
MTTELALALLFRKLKITGWRRHQKLFGKPDFVFRSLKLAVFVDGCFWHGCSRHGSRPRENRLFWERKISTNKKRDRLVNQTLRKSGWRIIRIWEHELTKKNRPRLEGKLAGIISGQNPQT